MKHVTTKAAAAALLSMAIASSANAAEVRVCDGALRIAPLNDERAVGSVVIQSFAVVNDSTQPLSLARIRLQLKQGAVPRDAHWLLEADIDAAAKQAPMIAAFAAALPSQFCNGKLLAGVRLANTARLGPGEGVVFVDVPLVWKGSRDSIEITVEVAGAESGPSAARTVAIDSFRSRTKALFPVAGTNFVAVAGTLHTPHRWAAIEEFALDILRIGGGGETHRGSGSRLQDYYAFGQPVRAVAAGRVVDASGTTPDNVAMLKRADESGEAYFKRLLLEQSRLLSSGIGAVLGNHVIIDHGNAEYSVYAHLKQSSLKVKAGDLVEAGQSIALLGSSGNSTEPHLHFQICETADMAQCHAIPIDFQSIDLPLELTLRTIQSGDIVKALH